MLGQRRRRWTNIEPTLVQYLVLAGIAASELLFLTLFTHTEGKSNSQVKSIRVEVALPIGEMFFYLANTLAMFRLSKDTPIK